jgi:predicted DNA-binding transcriptional regulator AlpA
MRLLDHHQVCERIGKYSKTTIWRRVKNDEFPPPAQDGGINKWPDNEIDAYPQWRINLRDGVTIIKKWSLWWKAEREAANPDLQVLKQNTAPDA